MKSYSSAQFAIRIGASSAALLIGLASAGAHGETYGPPVPAEVAATQAQAGTQAAVQPEADSETQEVVVSGYRASLRGALDLKKRSDIIMDAINAEDIADFPDANLAESLQRLPGISIDRDNGEGRTISVRGLDGGFSRVRINNMEALSTSGANNADGSPNRSRTFDFNAFASELFSSVRVRKSSSAEADEGSLGATVDLITGRPFDYKGTTFAISAEDSYYVNSKKHNPRLTALASTRVADGRIGFLVSAAYAKRASEDDTFGRPSGSQDYVYRNSDLTGDELPGYAGFAAPTGTVFTALRPTNLTGAALDAYKANPANYYNPISNPAAYAELTGSNPAAWAKLHPGCAAALAQPVATLNVNSPGCNDSQIRIPTLASLNQRNVETERLGVTAAIQIEFSSKTRLSIDGLYSRFKSDSTNYQLSSIGLNRNNTNAQYNMNANPPTVAAPGGSALTDAQRRGLYPGSCAPVVESQLVAGQDCGQALFGTTPLPGYAFSVNPNNRDPFEYYTNPASPGYMGPAASLPFRGDLIGRNATKVLAAEVQGQNAVYLELGNMDWRSAADRASYITEFLQASAQLDHEFTDRLTGVFSVGTSKSTNDQHGYLVEFNRLDAPGTFVYDARAADTIPEFDPGFNVADPNSWGIVKGFSAMRHFRSTTETNYWGWKGDLAWAVTDQITLKAGATGRNFNFNTVDWRRNGDLFNPTEKEAGVTVASLGNVVQFGQGLQLQGNTPTSFFVPSIEAFDNTFGFTCNCINKYGDWRLSSKALRGFYSVEENNKAFYGQVDFAFDVLGGRRLSGNLGLRYAKTRIFSQGQDNTGRAIYGENEYDDWLPAGNITFEAMKNLYVRLAAAKVMARPSLGNLSPQISSISIPNNGDLVGGSLTVGNPKLSPFRGNSFDVALEWYFTPGGLISIGGFRKELNSFPQQTFYEAPLSSFLDEAAREALKLQFPGATTGDAFRRAFIDADGMMLARQVRDTPGGWLQGLEISYQQDLTFLPGFLRNFGIQANMTLLDSEFQYLIDPGNVTAGTNVVTRPPTWAPGPWLGSSPKSYNATVYYETKNFSARISLAKRDDYKKRYPVGTGSCDPGRQANGTACNAPLINEFVSNAGTTNVDFATSFTLFKNLRVTFEALNLTNEPGIEYAYNDPVVTSYGSSGRNFRLGMRYKF